MITTRRHSYLAATLIGALALTTNPTQAADLAGSIQGAGQPIAGSTVTLFAANADTPKQLGAGAQRCRWPFFNDTPWLARCRFQPLSGRTGRAVDRQPNCGKQSCHRADDSAREQATGQVTINEMTTVASVWTHNQFIDGTVIKGQPLQLKIAAGNVPSFVDLATGGWGSDDPRPAQQRPDADDGQFRDAGRCAGRMRRAGDARCVQQALRGGQRPSGTAPTDTLTAAQSIAQISLVPAGAHLRVARSLLSGAAGQEPARGAVHALPAVRAQRLGAAAEVRRRRLPRRRQGDVRCRRQPLGRQQLHRRLAGQRRACGRATPASSTRTASRSRRSPPASPAAAWRAAPSARRST